MVRTSKIVSGSGYNTILIWDSRSSSCILGPLGGHTKWITSVAFSPDGKLIVSSSRDRTIRVWNSQNGETVCGPVQDHTDFVQSVVLSPKGKMVVSVSNNKMIWLYCTIPTKCSRGLTPDALNTSSASSLADSTPDALGKRSFCLQLFRP